LIGIVVEVGWDMDNVYDMTTTLLFVLIAIFAFLEFSLAENLNLPKQRMSRLNHNSYVEIQTA
jgi:hypothetical protein